MGRAKKIPENPDALFLPYQQRWVADRSRLKLMEKSRQIGLSWSTAYASAERTAARTKRLDEWVSSRDALQARLFIEDASRFASALSLAARDLGEMAVDDRKKVSAFVLEFANGRRIYSLSSNADAQAGKRGSRILDEFALHPGETVGIDERFSTKFGEMHGPRYPLDPHLPPADRVNCRCAMTFSM